MTPAISHRVFETGTTGWTVDDLADPDICWEWTQGRYELVEGVLTKMAPQGFHGVKPVHRLRRLIERRLDESKSPGEFYTEVDLLLGPQRIARPDMLFLTLEQHRRQQELEARQSITDSDYCPIFVMPLLVVESASVGHENHDRETKRQWYAQAGIPNYWILTPHERSLVCLSLNGPIYVEESAGRDQETIQTRAFGGLAIPLAELWRKL